MVDTEERRSEEVERLQALSAIDVRRRSDKVQERRTDGQREFTGGTQHHGTDEGTHLIS